MLFRAKFSVLAVYTKTMLLQCAALFIVGLVYSSPAGVQAQEKDESLPTTSIPPGQCVGANEVESLRYHLYSELSESKNEIETLRSDLQHWQNTTVSILKKYLLDSQGNGHNSNTCEEGIKELREMISSLQGSQNQCAPNITEDILRSMRGALEEHRNIQTQELQEMTREISDGCLPLGTFPHPAPSCKVLPQNSRSGNYWIQSTGIGNASLEYCDVTRTCCDSTGGWMRVANLDMTDPSQNCPTGFTTTTSPNRTCGRSGNGDCNSVSFPLNKISYSHVCGRILAYQYRNPNAFYRYSSRNGRQTIDGGYVDGVSLTHGRNPRKHIWTFANARDETRSSVHVRPCTKTDNPFTGNVPPFVGNDYFCDTGSRYAYQNRLYSEDPLWDGAGCGETSTCCEFNNPPWFCKQLPQPTTDDIELRLCGDEPFIHEDSKIELIELYVQ